MEPASCRPADLTCGGMFRVIAISQRTGPTGHGKPITSRGLAACAQAAVLGANARIAMTPSTAKTSPAAV